MNKRWVADSFIGLHAFCCGLPCVKHWLPDVIHLLILFFRVNWLPGASLDLLAAEVCGFRWLWLTQVQLSGPACCSCKQWLCGRNLPGSCHPEGPKPVSISDFGSTETFFQWTGWCSKSLISTLRQTGEVTCVLWRLRFHLDSSFPNEQGVPCKWWTFLKMESC